MMPSAKASTGFARPSSASGTKVRAMLPIPDVQGRVHNQVTECRGPAEEVSTTVVMQNVEEEEAEAARGSRSRRSRRSRDDGGGHEVVLDEA